MDTFPYADWAEALEANGAIFTWADNESAIFVLTALGIAAFVVSLVHIIRTEDRNLNHAAPRAHRARRANRWEVSEMAGKQVEFQENHTHKKSYERGMLILSLACIVFVIIAVNVVGGGIPIE